MAGYEEKIIESIKKYKGKIHPVDIIGYKLRAYDFAEKNASFILP